MNETKLAKTIKEWCKKNDYLYKKNYGSGFSMGYPDIEIISNTKIMNYIELKIKPNKPTPLQLNRLSEYASFGQNAFVLTVEKNIKPKMIELYFDWYKKGYLSKPLRNSSVLFLAIPEQKESKT